MVELWNLFSSQLNLVDLAGCEKVVQTGAVGKTSGGCQNQHLPAGIAGHPEAELSKGDNKFINYWALPGS
jgi:hypothetical protein